MQGEPGEARRLNRASAAASEARSSTIHDGAALPGCHHGTALLAAHPGTMLTRDRQNAPCLLSAPDMSDRG